MTFPDDFDPELAKRYMAAMDAVDAEDAAAQGDFDNLLQDATDSEPEEWTLTPDDEADIEAEWEAQQRGERPLHPPANNEEAFRRLFGRE